MTAFDVVIPTAGRPSLDRLLAGLARCDGPRPGRVVVVDDRAAHDGRLLAARPPGWVDEALVVLRGPGRGPAAARNAGWRACAAPWIVFLDDDVAVAADWTALLAADLRDLDEEVVASQGRVVVPLPAARRPTDWERNVAGLERARWATADMALRRRALLAAGGFDERFPRAYREDSDLGLRLTRAGGRIVTGRRSVEHPVRPADPSVSLRLQAGNADDALMRALHGPGWRAAAGAPPGRLRRHVAVAAAGALAVGSALTAAAWRGRARRTWPGVALLAGAAWAAGTAELAWARIAPGPRTPREVATMLATSAALPFAATWHRACGEVAARRTADPTRSSSRRVSTLSALAGPTRHPMVRSPRSRPAAVLLDRDGTLVADAPYNGDPAAVVPVPGARAALDRLRAAGVPLAVVSNQSGIARGLLTADRVGAVNARVEELLGPLGPWMVCPHGPQDGCACRKPAPGLVLDAAARLGVPPRACVLIGDIGADMEAAAAAGARGILVPTPVTRDEEVLAAPERAPDLTAAVDLLLGAGDPPTPAAGPLAPPAGASRDPGDPGAPSGLLPAAGASSEGTSRMSHVLVARLDNDGDVLLAGPAIRAVAAGASRVTLLCGPRGSAAAHLLPGVDEVIVRRADWIDPEPEAFDRAAGVGWVAALEAIGADRAIVLGSFHQSPLPLALLLRMAGVGHVAATSVDYPGSLLDVRHRIDDDVHEVQRSLHLVRSLGFDLPPGDDGALAVRRTSRAPAGLPEGPYVVVHPGASVPARAWGLSRNAALVEALGERGRAVVVTGGPGERDLTARVAGAAGLDLGGATDLGGLAEVLAGAEAVVVGNTGPAHLAAAVGTPVVSLYAPTVPAVRWRPWRVAHELLHVDVPCAGCRARACPVPGHPCLGGIEVDDVLAALERVAPTPEAIAA